VVSIDPGPRNTGVAVFNEKGEVIQSFQWDIAMENLRNYKRKHGKYTVMDLFQQLLTLWRTHITPILLAHHAEREICLVEQTQIQNIGFPYFCLIGYLHKWIDFHVVHPISVAKYYKIGGLVREVKKRRCTQLIAAQGYYSTSQHVRDAILNYMYFKSNERLFRTGGCSQQQAQTHSTETSLNLHSSHLINLHLSDKKDNSQSIREKEDYSPSNSPNQNKKYSTTSTSEDLQDSNSSPTMPKAYCRKRLFTLNSHLD